MLIDRQIKIQKEECKSKRVPLRNHRHTVGVRTRGKERRTVSERTRQRNRREEGRWPERQRTEEDRKEGEK